MKNRYSTTLSVTIELERPASFALETAGMGGYLCEGHCYVERTFEAKVSLVPGTRDELEVEWLTPMADMPTIDDLDDLEFIGAGEKAEEMFWDWLREQPSELDDAIDHHMAVCKERREQGAA